MRNYRFSLESVLEVRSNDEKNVLEEFVRVQNSLVEEENKRERLEKELKLFLRKNISNKNIQDFIMRNHYKSDLEDRIRLQDMTIDRKKIELEEVRVELQEAQKDKKIIEKLKEKDLDEYKTEISKKSQDEIDEFGVLRYKNQL